jgi:uncharacterized cupin superfamily protein
MRIEREAARGHNLQTALDQLHADVFKRSMAPFWAIDKSAAHDEDSQVKDKKKAVPFVWKYKRDIEPLLYRSAELINTESSERRSLILVNPGLAPRRASVSTMYTAYRLNDPNEVMPPHRHSPNAIRFGLTGSLNFTGVEGENITFGPGDMVLTPHDTWHNHGNQGDDPAINLSVLDLPLWVGAWRARRRGGERRDYWVWVGGWRCSPSRFPATIHRNASTAGRPAAALPLPQPRHRQCLAHVCLSLERDARDARQVPGLAGRSP